MKVAIIDSGTILVAIRHVLNENNADFRAFNGTQFPEERVERIERAIVTAVLQAMLSQLRDQLDA